MAYGKYEETEILLNHSEYVLANLETAAFQFRNDGPIMEILNTEDGKRLRKCVADAARAIELGMPSPQIPSSIEQLKEKVSMQMIMPIRTIDYAVYWCNITIDQLEKMTKTSREYDLTWNFPITISSLKLFSAFCRVVLYLHKISAAPFLIQLFSSSTLVKSLQLKCKFTDLLKFVNSTQKSPFKLMENKLCFMRSKMSLLVVKVLPFFSTLFADWTIFDWSLLSVIERSPESTIGDSMPLEPYILLANLSLFQEVLVLYALVFASFMDENQQFTVLGSAVISEIGVFYLSRNVSIPIESLLEVSAQSNSIISIRRGNKDAFQRKATEAHLHRMRQLIMLANEVENISQLDMTHFCRCIHIVRAIAGFSYYELNAFFSLKEQRFWTKEQVRATGALLSAIDKLCQAVILNRTEIERFFIFNLATADADHLSYMLDTFGDDLGTAGGDVAATSHVILDALHTLDLDKFDMGTRYDFYPLILTHGRALHQHNLISQRLRASFLTPLFEHLMTITMHAMGGQNAVRFFLDACPLHTFWRHQRRFEEYIMNSAAPLDNCVAFINLFNYFQYDEAVLAMHPGEVKILTNVLESKIRTRLSTGLAAMINNMLDVSGRTESRVVTYSLGGGSLGAKVPIDNLNTLLLRNDGCIDEAHEISKISQANRFIASLPESIEFCGKTVSIAPYIIENMKKRVLSVLLINMTWNVTAITDTASILWTFFEQARALGMPHDGDIGLVLKQSLLDAIYANTAFGGANLSDLADALLENAPETPLKDNTQTLISMILRENEEFIRNGHKKTQYSQSTQCFIGNDKQALPHYVSLLREIGISAALYIDHGLTRLIVADICVLLNSSTENDSNYGATAEALVRLSVAQTLRTTVRRAARLVIEEVAPGLCRLLDSSLPRGTKEAELVRELVSENDSLFFIGKRVARRVKSTDVGVERFFVYLADVITSPAFAKMQYSIATDSLSDNAHLIPRAFELLLNMCQCHFGDATPEGKENAVQSFFTELASKITDRAKGSGAANWVNVMHILVDKFPKMMPSLDYGQMKHVFTYSLLTSAYPSSD